MTVAQQKTKPLDKSSKLYKYYMQRYNLFSRFDDGILLDDESWYSVTPENIAEHIAGRVCKAFGDRHPVIMDGFCGVGGNLIQFACKSPHITVIGCDINEERIQMAKNNAKIYGVAHQCEFILGDFMEIMRTIPRQKIDAVFLSPPWGGVSYQDHAKYSLNSMSPNGYEIVQKCRQYLTDNIAFLMPRNVDLKEARKHLLDKTHPEFECEQNMVGKKIKTITVYFGELLDQGSETDTEMDN